MSNNLPNNPEDQVQNLQPFKKFCMTIGALPSSYLESLTYQELLLWFCDYLQNTVIPTVNNNAEAVKELQNLYIELKNYVDNYFSNLDVQDEINNKLDEMVEDGTLYNLIFSSSSLIKTYNTFIDLQNDNNITNNLIVKVLGYNSLNDGFEAFLKITNENYSSSNLIKINENFNAYILFSQNFIPDFYKNNNYFITISYSSVSDKKCVHISQDGINWSSFCELPDYAFYPNSYDISCIFYDGYFYMVYDIKDTSYNDFDKLNNSYFLGGNRLGITKTKDFINFEKWHLDFDNSYKQIWGPEFFIDNGKPYILVTMGDGLQTFISSSGNTGYLKKSYILDVSIDLKTVNSITQNLISDKCVIDPFIYKENDNYYLFIKDETNGNILQYKSDNLFNFNNLINTLDFYYNSSEKQGIEAPSLLKINNLFYLFCDVYDVQHFTAVFISDNIEQWYNHNFIYSDKIMYHFAPIEVYNTSDKNIMKTLFNKNGYPLYVKKSRDILHIEYINYSNKDFDKFFPLKNKTYVGLYGTYNLNNIILDTLNTGDNFIINSQQGDNQFIKLNNSIFNGFQNDIILNFKDTISLTKYIPSKVFVNYLSNNIITELSEIINSTNNSSVIGELVYQQTLNTNKEGYTLIDASIVNPTFTNKTLYQCHTSTNGAEIRCYNINASTEIDNQIKCQVRLIYKRSN